MQQFGFRSVFAKLFASVMLALTLFAVAMVLLTQLVHDKDANIRSQVLATQILGQIDPFLNELNIAANKDNRLQSRFMLAVVKKSFDIFDESLQAKMGLYDSQGRLLMQTDNSDLPRTLPEPPSLLTRVFPYFAENPPTDQAQVYSSTGYTLLYESRIPPKKSPLSAALNLFTGTLLLLIIMAGVLWWIARSMTWRINQMSQQMMQLGDGDFSVRVNARGNDEIASLARGFNQAAQKIEHLINANNLLLAHASHELRTPITRIRLQIEMMDMLASVMPEDTKAKFDKRAQAINRDLSGLNDLVESILLVSRLDAGHVMQQVEQLDLYDLINQERQHYSEATLIGEHITIDGQPPMLTHLIRNLLNNAMLHGVPPVTILLYGVQTMADADTVPDYLLQSVVCSSFADHAQSDYDEEMEGSTDTKAALTHLSEAPDQALTGDLTSESKHETISDLDNDQGMTPAPQPDKASEDKTSDDSDSALPAPIIYYNGETINPYDTADDHFNETIDAFDAHDHALPHQTTSQDAPLIPVVSDTIVVNHYVKLTNDFIDRLKKIRWRAVPEPSALVALSTAKVSEHNEQKPPKDKSSKAGSTDNKDSKDTKTTPADPNEESPKKGIFKKHLKKPKAEPVRPAPKYAVLAVIDEGSGIPEDKREDIFSPFVRLQQKKKGSGLGLSLVSQIVAAHQGVIKTDTINGHTRFLVIIPVKHDPNYRYQDPMHRR